MATTTSITTSYSGEFAKKYIAAALLTGNTIANGGLTVRQNIKFKEVLKKLAIDDIVKNGSCDFNPTSTITLTENILQPEEFQVNLALCKKDFRSDWDAMSMGMSAFDELPKSFADFLLAHVSAKVSQKIEQTIWRGVNANDGEFDGFETLLSLDPLLPASQEVAGIAITPANVIAELEKVATAIPSALWGQEDLYIYVPQNVLRAYVFALGGFQSNIGAQGVDNKGTMWYANGQPLTFGGVKLFQANGMTDNKMIAGTVDNLHFGTGLLSDTTSQAKVIDMEDIDGSQNVRVVLRYTAAVNYAFASEIVTYGIVNGAN